MLINLNRGNTHLFTTHNTHKRHKYVINMFRTPFMSYVRRLNRVAKNVNGKLKKRIKREFLKKTQKTYKKR